MTREELDRKYEELVEDMNEAFQEELASLDGSTDISPEDEIECMNCEIVDAIDKITLAALTTEGNISPETRANLLALNQIRNDRMSIEC